VSTMLRPRAVSRCGRPAPPLASLARDSGYEIEIGVVVEHDEASLFRRRGDQEIGDLSAPQPAGCKQPLDLASAAHVSGLRLEHIDEVVEHARRFLKAHEPVDAGR
jgi:hypothetical protein